ncbi:hypothetical protein [Ornithinimicrobium murale]|uniref:hypothetical protein n=1 Tax=Ornithinimicrobium murale TaxID=1050153 RepID=UPI000E0DEA4F|nr:hypothetical protein [Ornithinimicrobium murale]
MDDLGTEIESWLAALDLPTWTTARGADGSWLVAFPDWRIGGRGETATAAALAAINDVRAHIAHHHPESVTRGSRPVLPHGGTIIWLHPERVARAIADSS